jgi:hypothetical protein
MPNSALKSATLRRQLMAASCALLGAGDAQSQNAAPTAESSSMLDRILTGVTLDSALAYYREDGRVQAIEPVVNLNKVFTNGQIVGLDLTFDSLSGSSPNGATPSRLPRTFASPSGKSLTEGHHIYTVAPGALPADPNYQDFRAAAAGSWTAPLSRVTQVSLGGKVSGEDDFISVSANSSIAQDFNDKNTTVALGANEEFDTLRPIGGAPVAGSDYGLFEKTGNKTKSGVGALLGVTQVMTRNWLTELNVSIDRFHGYLNDPYKITSVLDSSGNTTGYVYENRPDQRTRKSVYLENRAAWNQVSTALSLRYMQDDWDIHSDTAQWHIRWSFANRERYLEPSLRWYRQSAADFYTPWITASTTSSVGYQASDSRLGAFHALTYGLKYAQRLSDAPGLAGSEFSMRLEYYQQTQERQASRPDALQGLDIYPGLKAVLLQIGWRF